MVDQIRIQSDGTGHNTVVTLANGEKIPNVRQATIWLDAREINKVDLDIDLPVLDVHAHPETVTFICRCCGETLTHECDPRD